MCSPPGAAGEWLVVSCGRVSCSTAGGRGSRGRAREPGRLPGAQLTHGPGPLAPAAATLSHHQPPSLIPLPLTSPATPTHFASIKPCMTRVNGVIKLRRDNYRCDHRPFGGGLGRGRGRGRGLRRRSTCLRRDRPSPRYRPSLYHPREAEEVITACPEGVPKEPRGRGPRRRGGARKQREEGSEGGTDGVISEGARARGHREDEEGRDPSDGGDGRQKGARSPHPRISRPKRKTISITLIYDKRGVRARLLRLQLQYLCSADQFLHARPATQST